MGLLAAQQKNVENLQLNNHTHNPAGWLQGCTAQLQRKDRVSTHSTLNQ